MEQHIQILCFFSNISYKETVNKSESTYIITEGNGWYKYLSNHIGYVALHKKGHIRNLLGNYFTYNTLKHYRTYQINKHMTKYTIIASRTEGNIV
jgi:hypothetical protein